MNDQTVRDTRLPRKWLMLARVSWWIVVGSALALFAISIPLQIAESRIVCLDPEINNCFNVGQLTPQLLQGLEQMGLSLDFYITYYTLIQVAFPLVFLAVGALIFWRKSEDGMTLLVSLMLIVFGLVSFPNTVKLLLLMYPALTIPILCLEFLGSVLLALFFFLFPDGRLVPRWIRWVLPFILVREGINAFLPNSDLVNSSVWSLTQVVEVAIALYAQIYRYRRVSGLVQRQQTKWVVSGVGMSLVGYFGLILSFTAGFTGWTNNIVAVLVLQTLASFFILLIPLSILIAILRYRLYEIDILIRRTLTYALVTALLALVYFGSVILLQQLVERFTSSGQDQIVTVLSTLAIAVLFVPLRNRIQNEIDKRFNRKKYNAQQVLTDFGKTVRDETDLEKLTARLMQVVDETMQPKDVSVWLKKTGREIKR